MAATVLSFLLLQRPRPLPGVASYIVVLSSLILLPVLTPLASEMSTHARFMDAEQLRNSRMDLA